MSNVLSSHAEATPVVNPNITVPTDNDPTGNGNTGHSIPSQTPNLQNQIHTCNINQHNKETSNSDCYAPVQNRFSYPDLAAARGSTQSSNTSGTPDYPLEERPKVLFTISQFRGKIIVDAVESKDACVINTRANGHSLTITNPNVPAEDYQSQSYGTTVYRFLRAFSRALFYPCAFAAILTFPDVYPAVVYWLCQQTDMFAFVGTRIQDVASPQLGIVLQYTVFCLIVTLSHVFL
ncbi:hypothetical protein K435DRAFT_799225 [Dendrothele bispora CBS 962.96]|uniref:Uncharacterized protein n=1 Tax=Dendrothele bispora (strain CBS 962.96) TaxID=1314807 RepID=A0A4S8LXU5_DENBC|nr:hypothetical protein K435DRAFT_799225 [Dendrothele bispora CBS 962.96]